MEPDTALANDDRVTAAAIHSILGVDAPEDTEQRIAALQRTAALAPTDGLLQYNCGTTLYLLGAFSESTVLLRRALDLSGPSNSVQHNLALALMQVGELEAALSVWLDVLQREPDWSWVLASAAEVLDRLGRGDEAWAHWQHYGATADPGCDDYNKYLDHLWMSDHYQALMEGSQARLARVRDASTLKYLALAHSGFGQHQAALDALQQAQSLDPDSLYLALMAKSLNNLQRYALAEQMADDAMVCEPDNGHALCEKAVALFSQRRDAQAEALLASYRGPMRFIARRCAEAMAAQRRFGLAGRLYERQLEITPDKSRTASLAGDCYRDAGERAHAITLYQRAEHLALAEGWLEQQAYAHQQQEALARRGGIFGWLRFGR